MNPHQIDPVIAATLHAADPHAAVLRHVRVAGNALFVDETAYDLDLRDIRLIATGKAAVPMAHALSELLGDKISRAVVVTKYEHGNFLAAQFGIRHAEFISAAHPVPDQNSAKAGDAICAALRGCTENTLVLACISGGSSALVVAPHAGISLRTLQAINETLLRSGADIAEMNAVRSRLDRLKGGGLVQLAQPAQVVGLILSDVVGDSLQVIASGMTHAPTAALPAHNVLVGNNTQACQAAAHQLHALGYHAHVVATTLHGEARERGAEIARAIAQAPPKTALIYGGETTVTICGAGKGGRNQELALAAFIEMQKLDAATAANLCIVALGTDGTDGPTDAAGAIASWAAIQKAQTLGLNAQTYLANNDSYTFFCAVGGLIQTGPTGTNVADVVVAIRDE